MACVPQYLSAVLGDLSRGSGQFVPKTRSAIEHLTRSRAVSRTCGSFSCRFLSWPVREGLPVSLLCKSGKGCGAKHSVNPPGYIRRLALPCPACSRRFRPGWQGQCGSSHAPPVCSLCGRGTICPENLATERPEARRVPTGHLVSNSWASRRDRVRTRHLYGVRPRSQAHGQHAVTSVVQLVERPVTGAT